MERETMMNALRSLDGTVSTLYVGQTGWEGNDAAPRMLPPLLGGYAPLLPPYGPGRVPGVAHAPWWPWPIRKGKDTTPPDG